MRAHHDHGVVESQVVGAAGPLVGAVGRQGGAALAEGEVEGALADDRRGVGAGEPPVEAHPVASLDAVVGDRLGADLRPGEARQAGVGLVPRLRRSVPFSGQRAEPRHRVLGDQRRRGALEGRIDAGLMALVAAPGAHGGGRDERREQREEQGSAPSDLYGMSSHFRVVYRHARHH